MGAAAGAGVRAAGNDVISLVAFVGRGSVHAVQAGARWLAPS